MEAGSSIYGLKPGAVYWLDKKVKMENAGLKCYVVHSVYLWYCHNAKAKGRRQRNIISDRREKSYRDRNIFVQYVYKPDVPGREDEVVCVGKIIVWDSIRRLLSLNNHKLMGTVAYHFGAGDWRRFYRLIGAVPINKE